MNKPVYRIFFSGDSLAACLSGAALVIMASDRLAHAVTAAGALVWVYCLSSLCARLGARFFPRQGRTALLAFLSSFFAGFYLVLLWMLSPLCALESFFVVSIVPMFCMASGIFKKLEKMTLEETLFASFSESAALGALIAIFAIIREPIGYLSLSLPGGAKGIIFLFSNNSESFFPVRLIASSCGALLLLGYLLQLYRYLRAQDNAGQEDEDGS